MTRAVDITGRRYGKLMAVAPAESPAGRRRWECLCDCGQTRIVQQNNLQSGNTMSCGCSHVGKKFPDRKRPRRDMKPLGMKPRHGHTTNYQKSSEYSTWAAMISRCTDPKCPVFPRYGGRGIVVCEGWRCSFEAFLSDMGAKPSAELSIDRRDNNAGYQCGHCADCIARGAVANCRWATRKEQARNMRSNRMLTLNGETMTLVEWAERTGIPKGVLAHRVGRKWSDERALTQVAQVHRTGGLTTLRFNLLPTSEAA